MDSVSLKPFLNEWLPEYFNLQGTQNCFEVNVGQSLNQAYIRKVVNATLHIIGKTNNHSNLYVTQNLFTGILSRQFFLKFHNNLVFYL